METNFGIKATEKIYCERCERLLNHNEIVWLEFSNTDGKYYNVLPDGHVSQGFFPFGKACARTQTKFEKKK